MEGNDEVKNINLASFTLADNANQLTDILARRISARDGMKFVARSMTDKFISGKINNLDFSIAYVKDALLDVSVSKNNCEETKKLFRVLKPIISGMNLPDFGLKDGEPIATYCYGDKKSYFFKSEDPCFSVRKLVFDNCFNKRIYNLKINLPEYKDCNLNEYMKYGRFEGLLTTKQLDEINSLSEFGLFLYINNLSNKINEMNDRSYKLGIDIDDALNSMVFTLNYALNITSKYGVKVNEPSALPINPSIETQAWLAWWGEGYIELLQNHPDVINSWSNTEDGYDKAFRPRGSFRDLLVNEDNERISSKNKDIRSNDYSEIREINRDKKSSSFLSQNNESETSNFDVESIEIFEPTC